MASFVDFIHSDARLANVPRKATERLILKITVTEWCLPYPQGKKEIKKIWSNVASAEEKHKQLFLWEIILTTCWPPCYLRNEDLDTRDSARGMLFIFWSIPDLFTLANSWLIYDSPYI